MRATRTELRWVFIAGVILSAIVAAQAFAQGPCLSVNLGRAVVFPDGSEHLAGRRLVGEALGPPWPWAACGARGPRGSFAVRPRQGLLNEQVGHDQGHDRDGQAKDEQAPPRIEVGR